MQTHFPYLVNSMGGTVMSSDARRMPLVAFRARSQQIQMEHLESSTTPSTRSISKGQTEIKWTEIQHTQLIKSRILTHIFMIVFSGILLKSFNGNIRSRYLNQNNQFESMSHTLVWHKNLVACRAIETLPITTWIASRRQGIMSFS